MILEVEKIKQEIDTALTLVKPIPKTRESFDSIINPILDSGFGIEGYFSQILKHQGGSGLAFEMLLFDSAIYYDIVVSSDDLRYNNTFIENITQILLQISPVKTADGSTVTDHSILVQVFFGDQMNMNYKSNINRLDDLLEVKRKINKLKRG